MAERHSGDTANEKKWQIWICLIEMHLSLYLLIFSNKVILPMRRGASSVFAVALCLSVCSSFCLSQVSIVPKWLNLRSWKIPMGPPQQRRRMQVGVGKIVFFNRSNSLQLRCLTAENLCPSTTVICVHIGVLEEEHAVSSPFVVVEVCLWHVWLTSALRLFDMEHRMYMKR